MLFSLNPGVTRDSRVTPGLPLDSKTGHKCVNPHSTQCRRGSKAHHINSQLLLYYCQHIHKQIYVHGTTTIARGVWNGFLKFGLVQNWHGCLFCSIC